MGTLATSSPRPFCPCRTAACTSVPSFSRAGRRVCSQPRRPSSHSAGNDGSLFILLEHVNLLAGLDEFVHSILRPRYCNVGVVVEHIERYFSHSAGIHGTWAKFSRILNLWREFRICTSRSRELISSSMHRSPSWVAFSSGRVWWTTEGQIA